MKNKTNRVVSELSLAISAVMSGDDVQATKSVAQALRLMTTGVVDTVAKVAKTPAKATKNANRRGPKPALTPEQVTTMVERVRGGESITNVAKSLKVSYATAHRYLKLNKQTVNN